MTIWLRIKYCILGILMPSLMLAQSSISGEVQDVNKKPVVQAEVFLVGTSYRVFTNKKGQYELNNLPSGQYELAVFLFGHETPRKKISISNNEQLTFNFTLREISSELDDVVITAKESPNTIRRLRSVEGAAIYEGKKNEVIELKNVTANLATNNSRQVYAKVPGLNIWESDGAGLQLGIGARGLDPSRTSNFNVRQNGYDISADALGYPESYYSPATEGLDRIELVRGAASLQYGTQFGGLLNFKMKEGPKDKPMQLTLRNTIGSYGFYNSFSSIGGTKGKFNYYSFFQYKKGDGWRDNSSFDSKMAYFSGKYTVNDKFTFKLDYTFLNYLARQPGGLTDNFFDENPRQSIRSRNWFRVDWNLLAATIDYKFSDKLKLNIRNFGLIGGRDALGNLERIDRADVPTENRNLFVDDFTNYGSELRLIKNYKIGNQQAVGLIGARYYNGFTHRRQGDGSSGNDSNFNFINPDDLENSDFDLPNTNASVFVENIFDLTPRFSLTPGVRFEYIKTKANGYYKRKEFTIDPVTGFAVDTLIRVDEKRERPRSFIFFGLGASYKLPNDFEIYSNFSQNYKSINFNDVRVDNSNLVVDENIQDEFGYNFDVGFRGQNDVVNFDVGLFYLRYNDRISAITKVDDDFRLFRFRSNISDARSLGIEAFGEANILKVINTPFQSRLNVFVNASIIDARYLSTGEVAIANKKVELVPPFSLRTGLSYIKKAFKATYQFSYITEQFTDATNADFDPSAVSGLIPAYHVMDLSMSYTYKFAKLEGSVNNLLDNFYFTRRADGYPGPGIIPADGRTFYLTLQLQF